MNRWVVVVLLALVGLVVSTHAWKLERDFEFDLHSMAAQALETLEGEKLQRDVNADPMCGEFSAPRPCKGPIQAMWLNDLCEGPIIRAMELRGPSFNWSICTNDNTQPKSLITSYDETGLTIRRYDGLECPGDPLLTQAYFFGQCMNDGGGHSFAFLYAVNATQNILPPHRIDGRAKDGPRAPSNPFPLLCTPNVNCTNDFIFVNHTSSDSCMGPIDELGVQQEFSRGVCYQNRGPTPETNVRWSCYHSEILQETFAYGCEGSPISFTSYTVDKSVSNASLAIAKCTGGGPMLACRNPTDKPIPSPPTSPVVCPTPTGNSASFSPTLFLLAFAAFISFVML